MVRLSPVTVERWRPVAGYEGHYMVSDMGRVMGLPRVVRSSEGASRRQRGVILRQYRKTPHHLGVTISRDGVKKNATTHLLVMEAFHGPRPKGLEASHINGDGHDNRASNLKWETHIDNMARQRDHGTRRMGERVHNAKLTDDDVRLIRRLCSQGLGCCRAARAWRVSPGTIRRVVTGERWSHVGPAEADAREGGDDA